MVWDYQPFLLITVVFHYFDETFKLLILKKKNYQPTFYINTQGQREVSYGLIESLAAKQLYNKKIE